MYDGFELEPTTKEVAIGVLIVLAVLVGIFCTGYMYGIRTAGKSDGGDVSDNGVRIDDVREQYQRIEVNQQQITSGLAGAVERSDTAAARAGRIEERAGASAQSVGEAGRLLDECQQIIGTVRNRGQAGKATH